MPSPGARAREGRWLGWFSLLAVATRPGAQLGAPGRWRSRRKSGDARTGTGRPPALPRSSCVGEPCRDSTHHTTALRQDTVYRRALSGLDALHLKGSTAWRCLAKPDIPPAEAHLAAPTVGAGRCSRGLVLSNRPRLPSPGSFPPPLTYPPTEIRGWATGRA
jgi:hypothetical protein